MLAACLEERAPVAVIYTDGRELLATPELGRFGGLVTGAHAESLESTSRWHWACPRTFGPRLRHLHVSSLSPELHHLPLTEEHEELFMPLLRRCRDVPWILEAPPRDP